MTNSSDFSLSLSKFSKNSFTFNFLFLFKSSSLWTNLCTCSLIPFNLANNNSFVCLLSFILSFFIFSSMIEFGYSISPNIAVVFSSSIIFIFVFIWFICFSNFFLLWFNSFIFCILIDDSKFAEGNIELEFCLNFLKSSVFIDSWPTIILLSSKSSCKDINTLFRPISTPLNILGSISSFDGFNKLEIYLLQKLGFGILPSSGNGSSGSIISSSGNDGIIISISFFSLTSFSSPIWIPISLFIFILFKDFVSSIFVSLSFEFDLGCKFDVILILFLLFKRDVLLTDLLVFVDFFGFTSWVNCIPFIKGGSLNILL